MSPIRSCKCCGKEFHRTAKNKNNWHKMLYCSRACTIKASNWKRYGRGACVVCGKPIPYTPGGKGKPKSKYCSRPCYDKDWRKNHSSDGLKKKLADARNGIGQGKPMCFTKEAWDLWTKDDEVSVLYLRIRGATISPCHDCLPSHQVEMRKQGKCDKFHRMIDRIELGRKT